MLPTSGKESGSWPTPIRQDAKHSGYAPSGPGMVDKLAYAVVRLPTPNSRDWKDSGASQGNRKSPNLGTIACQFPAPTCSAAEQGKNEYDGKRGQTLIGAATGQIWGTPRCADGMSNKLRDISEDKNTRGRLEDQVAKEEGPGGVLNPDWVEWLMGWPIGWTSLDPIDMEEFEYWINSNPEEWYSREEGARGVIPRVGKKINDRVARIKAIGNGQVSYCAAVAFDLLRSMG